MEQPKKTYPCCGDLSCPLCHGSGVVTEMDSHNRLSELNHSADKIIGLISTIKRTAASGMAIVDENVGELYVAVLSLRHRVQMLNKENGWE